MCRVQISETHKRVHSLSYTPTFNLSGKRVRLPGRLNFLSVLDILTPPPMLSLPCMAFQSRASGADLCILCNAIRRRVDRAPSIKPGRAAGMAASGCSFFQASHQPSSFPWCGHVKAWKVNRRSPLNHCRIGVGTPPRLVFLRFRYVAFGVVIIKYPVPILTLAGQKSSAPGCLALRLSPGAASAGRNGPR